MAHNLNFKNGKASFFSVREKAWHGLGTIVQDAPTSAEAIKLAGLDYEVEKLPIYALVNNNKRVEIPGKFTTMRMDTKVPFGVVGNDYTVLPNTEAFDFFDSIVGDKLAIYETAGALGQGETIFITAKLPNFIRVGKDDIIENYLFLTNNHNGEGMVTAALTPIRIVCNNTLNQALKNCTNRVKIMHRQDVKERVREAHKVMGLVNKMSSELEQIFNVMAATPIVDAQLKQIIVSTFATPAQLEVIARDGGARTAGESASLTRLESIISDAYAYALTSDTQQMTTTKGTVFGAYNAITGYLQNVKEVKEVESNLLSLVDGSGYRTAQKAFDTCLSLI
jgi:phage/plasmid-like protein (TIGR03299 family)